MVGDTFLTISGVLKYNRGGTSRELSAGGVLQLVPFGALGDANPAGSVLPLTGRNVPFSTVSTVTLSYTTTLTGGITYAQVVSNVALSTAIRTAIANSLSPPIPVSEVSILSGARHRRSLQDTSILYSITVPAAQASSISSQVVSSSFQSSLSTTVVSSVNSLGLGTLVSSASQSSATVITTNDLVGSFVLQGYTVSQFNAQVQTLLQNAIAQAITTGTNGVFSVTGSQVTVNAPASGRRRLLDLTLTYSVMVSSTTNTTLVANLIASPTFNSMYLQPAVTAVFTANSYPVPTIASPSSTTTTNNKRVIAIGVGVGVGGGCGIIILLSLVYFCVLKKKNVEQGQKSAVMMTPAGASA
jgi:hypothetical protein